MISSRRTEENSDSENTETERKRDNKKCLYSHNPMIWAARLVLAMGHRQPVV